MLITLEHSINERVAPHMAGLKLPGHLKFLAFAILLANCATTVALNPKVDRLPSLPKIPLSVGVYYSPELRSYMYESVHMYASDNWLPFSLCRGIVLPLGQAGATLFERLFPIIFDAAVTIETRASILPSKPSLIIEPDIEEVQCTRNDKATHVHITYYISLYSPSGEALGYWSVTGRGETKERFFEGANSMAAKAAELAMEDAAGKMAIQFWNIPAVQRLLKEKGRGPSDIRKT